MSNLTKLAIRKAFIQLLEEKQLKDITVRDIVDTCGVNRNTFYYHFRDIPELLEIIVRDDTDALIAAYPAVSSVQDCLNAVIDFLLSRRKAVMHIYRSVNRDIFEQYQWRLCEYAARSYITGLSRTRKIREEDREALIRYSKCVIFGLINGWLESGMSEDVLSFFGRIAELKAGDLSGILDRCEEEA